MGKHSKEGPYIVRIPRVAGSTHLTSYLTKDFPEDMSGLFVEIDATHIVASSQSFVITLWNDLCRNRKIFGVYLEGAESEFKKQLILAMGNIPFDKQYR